MKLSLFRTAQLFKNFSPALSAEKELSPMKSWFRGKLCKGTFINDVTSAKGGGGAGGGGSLNCDPKGHGGGVFFVQR